MSVQRDNTQTAVDEIIRMPRKDLEVSESLEHFNQKYTAPKFSYNEKEIVAQKEETTDTQKSFELEIPTLKADTETDKKIKNFTKENAKLFLSLKTKLIISVYCITMILLSALLIYNFAAISGYNSQIKVNSEVLFQEETYLDKIIAELNISKEQAETIKNNMKTIKEDQISNLDFSTKGESVSFTKDTNWFDAICNFLSSIFGG